MHLARIAYDAYCRQTGGRSLVTGDPLPSFPVLNKPIREAWQAAATAVLSDSLDDHQRMSSARRALTSSIEIMAALAADNEQLRATIDLMQRKQAHGCTDASCPICDHEEPNS